MRVEAYSVVLILILLLAPLSLAAEPPAVDPAPETEPIELQEEAAAESESIDQPTLAETQLNLFGQSPLPAIGGPGCMCSTWQDCISGCTPPVPGYPPMDQWCQEVSPGCGVCWC